MTHSSVFADQTYTALPQRVERMTQAIKQWLAAEQAARVLEIGCGTGGQLFALAEALPHADFVGIDISQPCIDQASAAREHSPHRDRLQFLHGSYTATPLSGGFDAILADSVLQLIEATDEELLPKLAKDLRPGGLLIFTIPYACPFNHLLWSVRRCFRLIRSRWTDRLILAAARKLHRHDMADDLLSERIQYMYLLPYRYWGPRLRGEFQKLRIEALQHSPVPHASLAQPKHCLCVCRKSAD